MGAVTAAFAGTRRTARMGEFGSSINCSKRMTEADTSGVRASACCSENSGNPSANVPCVAIFAFPLPLTGLSYHDLRRTYWTKFEWQ